LNNYPSYIAAIILAFCAIQSHKDLVRFQKILSYSAVFIVLIVAIEMIFNFKISHYLCMVNINRCNVESLHWASDTLINTGEYLPSERNSSIRRYVGHTGEPNSTAIILAMYTMFLFYYLARVKRGSKEFYFKAISLIFIVINSSVLIIGQTRAAIFLFFLVIFLFSIFKFRWLMIFISVLLILLVIYFSIDNVFNYINTFIINRLTYFDDIVDSQRLSGLMKFSTIFLESFGMGVGGTIYSVSENYLNSDDLSVYLLYFLVGGVFLGLLHLLFIASMLYDLVKVIARSKSYDHKHLVGIFLASILIATGVQIFNTNNILFYVVLLYSAAKSSSLPTYPLLEKVKKVI
jgi:hypothetical protein